MCKFGYMLGIPRLTKVPSKSKPVIEVLLPEVKQEKLELKRTEARLKARNSFAVLLAPTPQYLQAQLRGRTARWC